MPHMVFYMMQKEKQLFGTSESRKIKKRQKITKNKHNIELNQKLKKKRKKKGGETKPKQK